MAEQTTPSSQRGGPWGKVELEVGGSRALEIGTLHLALERRSAEVRVQARRADGAAPPDAGEWTRWVTPRDARLLVRPALPDRLLVVSPEQPLHLLPGAEARLFVRIPLFVQLVVSGSRTGDVRLTDEPSVVLSDTWWGTYEEGELGYWLATTARAEVSGDLFLPHVAMCPFHLANRGRETLSVDRFAVQVPHLSIFATDGALWTDEVGVRYEGSLDSSEIRFGGAAPAEAPGAERLSKPRVPPPTGFHARTFQRLRSLSGLGF